MLDVQGDSTRTEEHDMKLLRHVLLVTGVFIALLPLRAADHDLKARDYRFDGKISRPVLESYLSRAITMMDLCTGRGDIDDTFFRSSSHYI